MKWVWTGWNESFFSTVERINLAFRRFRLHGGDVSPVKMPHKRCEVKFAGQCFPASQSVVRKREMNCVASVL
ncbi:unnamed protein product [Ilex paraguariensis]|uniref:Uncharacterized protein n=1 Tax=Ilex paraguariensis TaxID=185542 RepID=A0ABC8RS40_9AQUA